MRKHLIIFCAVVSVCLVSCETKEQEPKKTESLMPEENGSGEKDGYLLVWEDLFDGDALGKWWNIEVNDNGGGNNELQYYTENNVSIETDNATNRRCLVITAKKEEYKGRHCTSGRLNTMGNIVFKHGKVESLIKLPVTYKGLWPAFWMMGNDFKTVSWPKCGEIDIMEMGLYSGFSSKDRSSRMLNGALHCAGKNQHVSYNTVYDYPLQNGEFHLFTMIWDENAVNMYIDLDKFPNAKPYFSYTKLGENPSNPDNPSYYFHKPFFIIFNLAIGGSVPRYI